MSTDVREETTSFLTEYPETEDALDAVLELDRQGAWSFEDIPLDSGRFGELVSRGIAESVDGGYRLADRRAVAVALDGDSEGDLAAGRDGFSLPRLAFPRRRRLLVGSVLAGLLLVVGLRVLSYPQVFRGGDVVLSSNDPYFYRYWVERLLDRSSGLGGLQSLRAFPEQLSMGEPLLVATLWATAAFLGGDPHAAGLTLAWYPVVSAAVVGGAVYLLANRLFEDRRVALASVVVLALTPVHAYRSSLGFGDHHAFDYVWLSVTMLTLAVLAERSRLAAPRPWIAAGGLGIAITGQALAWEAGPLLLVPVGVYAWLRSLSALRTDRSPPGRSVPLLAGLGLGALLTALAHEGLGWQTAVVAYAPSLLFLGSLGVFALGGVAHRVGLQARYLAGVEVAGVVTGVAALSSASPAATTELVGGLEFLFETRGIAETTSIVSGQLGSIFGPVLLFGWMLPLAVPYLAWFSLRAYRRHTPATLVPVVYAWFFLGLATVQLRFAGELAVPVAPLAGFGFVHLAHWLGSARDPPSFLRERSPRGSVDLRIPDRQTAVSLLVLLLLVGSMSLVMIPVKTDQITVPAEKYRAATAADRYAAAHESTYPENYVFSDWDDNRMYNYFVSGESRSYGYARSNYGDFLRSSDGAEWYARLRDRAGFVVTERTRSNTVSDRSLQARLHTQYGSESPAAAGLSHYRAVYVSEDGSVKLFAIVPGARLVGTADPDTAVSVSTNQSVTGHRFTYSRTVETDASGEYSITVPYPGVYTVEGRSVQVSDEAVRRNSTVEVD